VVGEALTSGSEVTKYVLRGLEKITMKEEELVGVDVV
jgi:hypothetical protein